MIKCFALISLLACVPFPVSAQTLSCYPNEIGQTMAYDAMIETGNGYVSGICIIANDGEEVKGGIFNEFGLSALDFSYDVKKDKVKLNNIISFLDKWYIRKVLRKDLRRLLHAMQEGKTEYRNTRYGINYKLERRADYDIER